MWQRKVYDDSDGQRKDEIASMAGSNAFSSFYDRVKELKEYHRRHPNSGFTEKEDLSHMISEQPWVDFTGEVRPPELPLSLEAPPNPETTLRRSPRACLDDYQCVGARHQRILRTASAGCGLRNPERGCGGVRGAGEPLAVPRPARALQ